MSGGGPLVTIGIPTYNRAVLLGRAIDSALAQDYAPIEVIVSDNASSDDTEPGCRNRAAADPRLRYLRQPVNVGATRNFEAVLEAASGEYFMWLGDDDWIDSDYVRLCLARHLESSGTALAGGAARYYQRGSATGSGSVLTLLQRQWWRRVIAYFWRVRDNGIYYGLARTSAIREVLPIRNTMAGDWLHVAALASQGTVWTDESTSVHRELGGATESYAKIASSLGLSKAAGQFPFSFIAYVAFADIAWRQRGFGHHTRAARWTVATVVAASLMLRGVRVAINSCRAAIHRWHAGFTSSQRRD